MCSIQAPSGNEKAMTAFVLDYVKKNKSKWVVQPRIYKGKDFQDCLLLVFGKPRTAVFAHLDAIGFTVRYNKELIKIGGPRTENGYALVGKDSIGKIECRLNVAKDNKLSYTFNREIDRGTSLTFKPDFRESVSHVQCCYLDNRLGVWNALKVAETLKNGIIAFSCWEEQGGGSVEYLARFIYKKFKVRQALISDITWVTEGIKAGKGVAISMRDSGLPRRSYVEKIISIAQKNKLTFQLEVEGSGGSDGNALQRSPYPFDWCFVGAPEEQVHSPNEKVHKDDIQSMTKMYQVLMKEL